ncbi:MAG: VCBS repeat-containing protein, partial [Saprospiraceae bacterium]|nr:VCBS repeat-containing protein [Saprospiraceae bacterium]
MKLFLALLFMAPAPLLFSQIFAEYPTPSPFQGLFGSSIAFSDVDGDGDEDVLVAGSTYTAFTEDYCTVESITKLYLNDGTGIFTELPDTPFEGVSSSSIAFSDVNGDGAADVLITGWNSSGTILSKLYTNDGNGNFTEVMDTPFEEVSSGSIAFSDVNGDGAADVLITGWNSSGAHIAKLYTNNGSGEFSEVPDTPFEGVSYSSVAFADIDGNGAPDVLITGRNGSGDAIAKLYTNDGGGGFLELPDTTLEGVYDGAVAFSDVDGNGAVDLLLTGNIASYDPISR